MITFKCSTEKTHFRIYTFTSPVKKNFVIAVKLHLQEQDKIFFKKKYITSSIDCQHVTNLNCFKFGISQFFRLKIKTWVSLAMMKESEELLFLSRKSLKSFSLLFFVFLNFYILFLLDFFCFKHSKGRLNILKLHLDLVSYHHRTLWSGSTTLV